jgi:hypothetical protein
VIRIADFLVGLVAGTVVIGGAALVTGWTRLTADFGLGLTAGLISSALVVIILGVIRAPRIELDVGDVADGSDQRGGTFRIVHLRVSNVGLRFWRWQIRRPATQCRAELAFGDLGAHGPRFVVDGRWSSLPEPVQNTPVGQVLDAAAVFGRPREVLNPADPVLLCVAIKRDGAVDCFAFNNRSYLHPQSSNPAWALGPGTYWVRVRLVAAEVEETRVFELVNTAQQSTGLHLQDPAG